MYTRCILKLFIFDFDLFRPTVIIERDLKEPNVLIQRSILLLGMQMLYPVVIANFNLSIQSFDKNEF